MEGKTWTENIIEKLDFNGQSIEEKTKKQLFRKPTNTSLGRKREFT